METSASPREPQPEYPDYSGVPLQQLRQVLETYRGNRTNKAIAARAGLDSREFARVTRVAPGTAILGLNKVDRLVHALGLNITELTRRGELDVVPLGSSKLCARMMVMDALDAEGICPSRERVETLATELINQKRAIIAAL